MPSFLRAEWRKLAIANYSVSPDLLKPILPFGTELDLFENKCYVSLVGFMFLNTKLKGISIPFHTNFEEVNLRFYVRKKSGNEWKRGVVFIKELVPKTAITLIANLIYGEHYQTVSMNHRWTKDTDTQTVEYGWKYQNQSYRFSFVADNVGKALTVGGEDEFITEHYWGYTKLSSEKTGEYEVRHPRWVVYPVLSFDIQVDFGEMYGPVFSFLNHQKPDSVMLAEGSEISVEPKRVIQ